jgi:hypothetical protein
LTFTAAILATQMVAADIMIFAGVDPDQTLAAMREGAGDFRVTSPPRAPRWPFWANR